ncbi:hypothetical protein LZZ85_22730 [Terrimonas sp. NA20]|uniref:DUF4468 domain-containing protein n=1 Tax=Terrimonas ginsenosidimutans TaxID=2908004 RepID=A0ABS9KXM0_9BACT|nr:hypothetical protein [Terrimonas ginsenosidimutans]MCG2617129.1 hypothetical protein [Terrimonas ginsenosidimutans]
MIKCYRQLKIIVCLSASLTAKAQTGFSGKFLTEVGEYYNQGKDTIFYGKTMSWLADSMLIREISTSVIRTEKNTTRMSVRVDRVIFIDYRTKALFEYSGFSDTARLMGSHFLYDTFRLTTGYPFDIKDEDAKYSPRLAQQLDDTLIDNIKYHRYLEKFDSLNVSLNNVFYTDCESSPAITMLPKHAMKFGCPVLMATSSTDVELRRPYMFTKRTLERDYLTPEEQKIFEAWRKYAEEHPVKPSLPKKKPKSKKRKKPSDK